MANYYTNFSALLDVKTPENAKRALEIYTQARTRNDIIIWFGQHQATL